MDIYRVVFNAAELIALINEEQGASTLGANPARPVRAADANFGGFARWLYINANT